MIYVMTTEDLKYVLSLSETPGTEYSPAVFPKRPAPSEEVRKASDDALSRLGFVEDAALSPMGRAITDALLVPERVVQTYNAALTDNAPVFYCYFKGFWVLFCPDVQYKLCTIISPVLPMQIIETAKVNLLHGIELPAFEPFSVRLNEIEAVLLGITDLIIAERALKKDAPLTAEESWFPLSDVYHLENLAETTALILPDDKAKSDRLLGKMCSAEAHKQAVKGLIAKGLLEAHTGEGGALWLRHGVIARKWLLSDRILDRVAVTGVYPVADTRYYRITRAGILRLTFENEDIIVRSVPDMDHGLFVTCEEPTKNKPEQPAIVTRAAARFCTQCGAPLKQDSQFCTSCGKPVNWGQ